jgi:dTDP-4-dehydrorhamnose reductase
MGISLHAALSASCPVERVLVDYGMFSDRSALERIINNYCPGTIINCAEYSDVDRAEYDRETAYAVNSFAVGTIAALCRERDALLVNLSTSSVFSGGAGVPVEENDGHDPVNVFGDSRSLGETFVAESGCRHLTVRLPYVYGGGIPLLNHGLAMMNGQGGLAVHSGQVIAPISAPAASAAVATLIAGGATGTFHVGPGGSVPAADFAGRALDLLHGAGRISEKIKINGIADDDFLAPAVRPLYNVLDTGKYSAFTGLPPSGWEEALDDFIRNNHGSLQITDKEHVQ